MAIVVPDIAALIRATAVDATSAATPTEIGALRRLTVRRSIDRETNDIRRRDNHGAISRTGGVASVELAMASRRLHRRRRPRTRDLLCGNEAGHTATGVAGASDRPRDPVVIIVAASEFAHAPCRRLRTAISLLREKAITLARGLGVRGCQVQPEEVSLLSTTRRSLAARSQSSTSRDLGAPQTCPTPTGSRPKASPNSCRSGANARSISARPAPAYCRSTDIPGHRGVEFRPERSGPRRARQQSRQCGPLVCAARALL